MIPITVKACAKINLTLDVFNRRADGYHSLSSVVQTVGLFDTIRLEPSNDSEIRVECTGPHSGRVPADASNLAARAARTLLDAAHCESGLAIHLHKEIPSQAGLGGGSSDAAAVLLGVASAFGLDIGPKLLHSLASDLGSDVPFFLSGGTAVMRGRGEQSHGEQNNVQAGVIRRVWPVGGVNHPHARSGNGQNQRRNRCAKPAKSGSPGR